MKRPAADPDAERGTERTAGTEPAELSVDEAFTLLRNERRRAVLDRLRVDPDTTLSDLTDHIAAVEAGTTPEQLRSKERKRVYISLYQSHLPTLADAGVVEYDRNRGNVRRLPAADQLDCYLERLRADESRRSAGRLPRAGLAVGAVVVAGAVGVPPLGAVDPVWWAVVGVAALAALAAAHRRSERP